MDFNVDRRVIGATASAIATGVAFKFASDPASAGEILVGGSIATVFTIGTRLLRYGPKFIRGYFSLLKNVRGDINQAMISFGGLVASKGMIGNAMNGDPETAVAYAIPGGLLLVLSSLGLLDSFDDRDNRAPANTPK